MATGMEGGSVCGMRWRSFQAGWNRWYLNRALKIPESQLNRKIMLGTALATHRDGEMAAHSRSCRAMCLDSGAAGETHKQDSGEGVGPIMRRLVSFAKALGFILRTTARH